jgi:hypothetical protein
MEKRRFERVGIRIGAHIEVPHRSKAIVRRVLLAGQLQSASPAGLGFQIEQPAEPPITSGHRINVRFGLDGWELELPARVVYARGAAAAPYLGLALELELASAVNRQRYVEWIISLLRPAVKPR